MKEPNKFHNYETEKITHKASDLSLHFNGHFIEAKVMEVAVTTGAIRHAKLLSSHHQQQTNTQFFTGRMPFLSPNQQ